LTVIVTCTVVLYGTVDSYRNVYSCVIWNCWQLPSRVQLCYMELLTVIVTCTVVLYGTFKGKRNIP